MVRVSAGFDHSLAVTEAGHTYSWGNGDNGMLGHGDTQNQHVPKLIEALQAVKVVAVSAGIGHSLAVDAMGKAWGWGFGRDACLGLELTGHQHVPLQYRSLTVCAN